MLGSAFNWMDWLARNRNRQVAYLSEKAQKRQKKTATSVSCLECWWFAYEYLPPAQWDASSVGHCVFWIASDSLLMKHYEEDIIKTSVFERVSSKEVIHSKLDIDGGDSLSSECVRILFLGFLEHNSTTKALLCFGNGCHSLLTTVIQLDNSFQCITDWEPFLVCDCMWPSRNGCKQNLYSIFILYFLAELVLCVLIVGYLHWQSDTHAVGLNIYCTVL